MSYVDYKQATKGDMIERRVEKTCRQVKQRDVFLTLTILLTCMVAYFFLFALLDHWIFKGGVSAFGRKVFLLGGLAAAGIYAVYRIFPLLRYSINPIYAAKILEGHRPTMKNTLINWIFLRRDQPSKQNPLQNRMLDGVAAKTVRDLNEIPTEMVVDHTAIIRWGFALVALVVILALYTLFSPKNPLSSFARLANPFTNIQAPTRVRFLEITPGNATVAQGETTMVTAHIEGVRKKPVYLYYSTDDGRLTEQIVPMSIPEGGFRYECRFPPGKSGFEQGMTYQIGVGDERSIKYRFKVQSPQLFEVQSITYKYPAYTGVPDQTVQGTGDIRAVEGTQVFITAKSNFSLKTAAFVPNGDETEGKKLTVDTKDDNLATFSFYLNSQAGDPNRPEYQSYVLRGYDSERNTNKNPSVYRIEMLKDKPPKISWVDPPKEQLEIPQNGFTEVRVTAEDADFGLRYIRIHFDIDGKTLAPMELLPNSPATGPTKFTGGVNIGGTIKPDALRLAVGDEVEYWAEAVDTLLPKGNTAITDRLSFVVIPPKAGADKKDANEEQQQKTEQEIQQEHNKGEQEKDSDNQQTGDGDSNASQDDPQPQENNNQEKEGENKDNKDDKNNKSDQPNQNDNQNDNQKQEQQQNQKPDGEQQNADDNGAKDQQDSPDDQQQDGNTAGDQSGEQDKGDGDPNGPKQSGSGKSDEAGQEEGSDSDGEMSGSNEPGTGEQSNEPGASAPGKEPGGQGKEGPLDPDSQPGDVFEKVLERMQEQGRETDPNKAEGQRTHSDDLDPDSDQLSDKGTAPKEMPKESIKRDENTPTQEAYKTTDDNPNARKEQADPDKTVVDDPSQKNATQSGEEMNSSQESDQQSSDEGQPNEPGASASGQPSDEGQPNEPGASAPGQPSDEGQSNEPGASAPGSTPGQEPGEGKQPGGGGSTSINPLSDDPNPEVPSDPNLDFKEKQTSLALRYLEEEMAKKEPDPELLKQLGWSKDDLKAFVEKWKAMSNQAQQAVPGSKEDNAWKEMLRSLGTIKPSRETSVQTRTTNRDQAPATGSRRINPPPNLRDRANAYNEGVSK